MKRTSAWACLLLLLALVGAMNWAHFEEHPFPPRSNHFAFRLTPRLVHQYLGYPSCPTDAQLSLGHFSTAAGVSRPLFLGDPHWIEHELRKGGRFWPILGKAGNEDFWTHAPHAFALPALLGFFFPGRATLVAFGHTIYFFILILSTAGIARRLATREAGVVAAFVAAASPALLGYSRYIEGYLPAAAMASLLVYLVLETRGFSRLLPSAAFGLAAWSAIRTGEGLSDAVGVGLLVLVPFVSEAWHGLRDASREGRPLARSLLGLGIAVGIVLWTYDWRWGFPWAIVHSASEGWRVVSHGSAWNHVMDGFEDFLVAARPQTPHPTRLQNWLAWWFAYLLLYVTDYLKPLLLGWLLLALPFLLARGPRRKGMILLWFLLPLLAYSRMTRKALWYALPTVTPLAVMVGVGLASLREVTARRVAMGLAGLVALAQLLTLGLRGGPLWSFLTSKALDREQYLQIRGDVFDKGDGLLRLRGQSGQFVEWMNRNDPPGPPEEGIRIVAVISEIPGRHLGRAFAWYVQLRRPDLVVLEIARDAMQPDELDRCVDPDRVRYLVFLRKDAFGPCCDASGKFDPPFSHQSDSFGFRYERLIESLLARADPVEGLPPVYRVRP